MTDAHIDLGWWPPDRDAPIGEERARELVAALKPIIGPVVDAAEADLRARAGYAIDVCRYAEPTHLLATRRLAAEMRSLCLGIVYQANANPAVSASIQLLRAGRLTWRRD